MAETKWIKIATDIFDDEKLALIDVMPERDAILVIWFKLLCMAGRLNNSGVFMLTEKMPYNTEMLAAIFRRPLNIVQLALDTFEQFGMVSVVNKTYTLPNWEKHQSLDKLEAAKEKNRQRVAAHRERQKQLALNGVTTCQYCGGEATGIDHIIPLARGGVDVESNTVPCCITCNRKKNDKPLVDFLNANRDIINDEIVTANPKLLKHIKLCNITDRYIVTQCNAIEEEREKEIDKNKNKESKEKATCKQVVDLYTQICISFPSVRSLTEARKKAIKARLNTYTLDDFKKLFEMAEASAFLKGSNDRNWTATFDWLIKDTNMAKVLEGNYTDKPKRFGRNEKKPAWLGANGYLGSAELEAIQRMANNADQEDPEVLEQAEAMQKKMQEKYGKTGKGV